MVCTFVFTLFTFFYLYYYQADLLTVMQHVFSKGQTHYNHLIGAVLITLVLLFIQLCVVNIFRKIRMAWALTFMPSAFCLAWLTDVRQTMDGSLEFGIWTYVLPVALIVYSLVVWSCNVSGLSASLGESMKHNVRQLWVNLVIILGLMLLVCFSGNNDKVYHTRIHAEQCLLLGDADSALKSIKNCGVQDDNLTMLTAYALSCKGGLAESLFEYPLHGGSHALMPDGKKIKFEMLPERIFYIPLGGWYIQRMSTMKYLNYQKRHNRINRKSADYLLCSYLMDRNLDAFAVNISKYYTVNDSVALPKHYKEALILYTHLRSAPSIVYKNDVMEADYQDYQKLEVSKSDVRERKTALRDTYGNTYWYYYQYK